MAQMLKSKKNNYFVHASSCIDPDVIIGEGSRIWHFCHILSATRIGKNCKIGQNVVIGPDVTIGNNAKIQNNVSLYKGVTLEDDVFCGPSCVFTNVFNPRSAIPRMEQIRLTHVRKGASIGANATILCGIELGEYSFIGAGSVVTKDVPAYGLVYGNPAKLKGWMCACGEKLHFSGSKATCGACNRGYVNKEGRISPLRAEASGKVLPK